MNSIKKEKRKNKEEAITDSKLNRGSTMSLSKIVTSYIICDFNILEH